MAFFLLTMTFSSKYFHDHFDFQYTNDYSNDIVIVLTFTDYLTTPTVAFNVRAALQTTPTVDQIIRFQVVLLNLGQAYDEVTGIFTAPVNGTYWFGVQAWSGASKEARLEIAVDAVNKVISLVSDYEKFAVCTSTHGSAAVYLNKGQRTKSMGAESVTINKSS